MGEDLKPTWDECKAHVMRLRTTDYFPSVKSPEGQAAIREMVRALHETCATTRQAADVIDEFVTKASKCPSAAEIRAAARSILALTAPEWSSSSRSACTLCRGVGYISKRRDSDGTWWASRCACLPKPAAEATPEEKPRGGTLTRAGSLSAPAPDGKARAGGQ